MRYAQIRSMDISNGAGVGVALFVQGCPFHCKGCFNQETWRFDGGKEFTPKVRERFLELASKHYVQRISILGGEPLCDENVLEVWELIKQIRRLFPNKQIWLWTGYTYERIQNDVNELEVKSVARYMTLLNLNVLVDGQYDSSLSDPLSKQIVWAGSTNQRVIDIDSTKKNGYKPVLYEPAYR